MCKLLFMGKKLVMAQRRGETRALCLGVAMVVGAVITYYILGTTVLPLYQKRYRTPRLAPTLQSKDLASVAMLYISSDRELTTSTIDTISFEGLSDK